MGQKSFAIWLKCMIAGVCVCLLAVYGMVIPIFALNVRAVYPEFSYCFWPWLIFLWITALPCYGALGLGWRITSNIGRDQSFCDENARLLKVISFLAAGDAAYFFAGNIVLLLLNMNHPGIALGLLLVVFAGAAVAAAAAALSHLVKKAAVLQEQSDLTI